MSDDDQRSASEIANDSGSPRTGLQRVENGVQQFLSALLMVIKYVASFALSIVLLALLLFWFSVLFGYLRDTSSIGIFGPEFNVFDLLFIVSAGVLLLVPLLAVLSAVTDSSLGRRTTLFMAGLWAAALVSFGASAITVAPQVEDYLIENHTRYDWIDVKAENGSIIDLCIGDCGITPELNVEPKILEEGQYEGLVFSTYTGEEQYQYFINDPVWTPRAIDLPYELSSNKYYNEIQNIVDIYGPIDTLIPADQPMQGFSIFTDEGSDSRTWTLRYFVREY